MTVPTHIYNIQVQVEKMNNGDLNSNLVYQVLPQNFQQIQLIIIVPFSVPIIIVTISVAPTTS